MESNGLNAVSSGRQPPYVNEGIVLDAKWKQLFTLNSLFVATSVWVILTTILAFISSSEKFTAFFLGPSSTILVLNVMSTGSVFLLGELVTETFEILRWALSVRPQGIGLATFFAIGRATNILGTIRIMFSNQRVGHRKWCAQR